MIAPAQIERLSDATSANELLNHPAIRPWIAGGYEGNIDLQSVIDNESNVVLGCANGVVSFIKLQTGYYEMHTAVMPEYRGRWVQEAAKYCFRYLFTNTDAIEVITRVPLNNPNAQRSALKTGFHYEFTTLPIWKLPSGEMARMDVYTLSIHKWVNADSEMAIAGEWLHKRYDEEFKRLGVAVPEHPHDDNHNHYAGAAVSMIRTGQVRKAIGFYNRWALLAGYSLLNVTSLEPLDIEVDGFTMRLTQNDFEIVKCPQLPG